MSEFLAMGGYGSYVWSAWGITLLVIVLNGWLARRRHMQSLERLMTMNEPQQTGRIPQVRRNS